MMEVIEQDFQIDNVQSFMTAIGDNDSLWNLLVGRVVSRFNDSVSYIIRHPDREEIKDKKYACGKVHAIQSQGISKIVIEIDYGEIFLISYKKESFVKEFNKIQPSFSYKYIAQLLRNQGKQEVLRKILDLQESNIKRNNLIAELKDSFEHNFLDSHNFYQVKCSEKISFKKYRFEKSSYVKLWIEQHLGFVPDIEQAAAIAAVEGHVQVIARAGSGKTSTLVNRALFLQKHCGVAPHEMLLLAFNRKAAEEIKERLTLELQESIPHVMTFHALAYALVHPKNSILFDEPDGQQTKSRTLQKVIDIYLKKPDFYEKMRILMLMHFRQDWERITSGGYDRTPEEMLRYRRSLPREGIDGTYVKSYGEKIIVDFLFEHNISYKYERNFPWGGINYRPDFTIGDDKGVVIEYFGLEGDPDYDAMSEEKRNYWHTKANWTLLELTPKIIKDEGVGYFLHLLQEELEYLGIKCNRLSEEEIWKRIKNRAIYHFTKVVEGFTQRCRKLSLTTEKLAEIINSHYCTSKGEEQFLELAYKFYQSYLEYLESTGEDDFDGLMQKAAAIVKSGQTIFRRKSGSGDLKHLRYVFIDEYQDFSELFYNLIAAVREQNPQASFFCVGDDWQAINGFAGSDLHFYQNFANFFQPSQKLYISTNYRSATSIVNIGNKLMQGFGNPASANQKQSGKVEIVDLVTFKPTHNELEEHPGDSLTPAILRIVDKVIKNGQEVVLICRKNSIPWDINYRNKRRISKNSTLERFLKLVHSYLPEDSRNKVTISTAHKYKGLEKDVVIILDAVPRCYPLIHPDLMFTRVFGDSIERVIDEERRLFYVALTRAVNHLFIVTETNNFSPFIEELTTRTKLSLVNWSEYPPFVGIIKRITVKVGNQAKKGGNGTFSIKHLLYREGYGWKQEEMVWCRTYPIEEFSVQHYFDSANWISHASGIEVTFYDDLENKLAIYHADRGLFNPVFDNLPKLENAAINIPDNANSDDVKF